MDLQKLETRCMSEEISLIGAAPLGFSVDHLLTSFVQVYCKLHHFRTNQFSFSVWLLESSNHWKTQQVINITNDYIKITNRVIYNLIIAK